VVELDEADGQIALSSEETTLSAAEEGFDESLGNPTHLSEFKRKPRFDDYLVSKKMNLEDKIVLNDAKKLYEQGNFEQALALFENLSLERYKHPRVTHLREDLKKAVAEQGTLSSEEITPFSYE
jgi:hypothetical protein